MEKHDKIVPFKYIKSTLNKEVSMREWLDEDEVLCKVMIQNLTNLKNFVYSKNTIFIDPELNEHNLCIILNFKEPDTKKNIKMYNLDKIISKEGKYKEVEEIIRDKYEIDVYKNEKVLERYRTKVNENTNHFYKLV